jgi:hypothetical protein
MSQLLAIQQRRPDGTFMPGYFSEQRKVLESTLRRAVAQDKAERLRNACERLLDMAANAEDDRVAMAAFSIIADRLDGKAVARIETSEGAPRDLGLAEIVALVLQHRKAEAIDAPSQHTGGGMGEGDIPMDRGEAGGG